MPPEFTVLAIARSLDVLPDDVRAMAEDDVLDQLAWMNVEGLDRERRVYEAGRG